MSETNVTEALKASPTTARDTIRASIFAAKNREGKRAVVNFFGTDIEIHQPSVGDINRYSEQLGAGDSIPFAEVLINYAYVPSTETKVFESGDIDTLNELPFNEDIQKVISIVEGFTNVSPKEAEKN